MKKIITFIVSAFTLASLFAYNPPVQGENLLGFTNPEIITGGSSTAGGGLRSITPSSVTMLNPALADMEDRVALDIGYAALLNNASRESSMPYGQAFGTGILIPNAWCTVAGEVAGVSAPFHDFNLGNSINLNTAVSKQVAEKIFIGAGVGGGYHFDHDTDWALYANVGAVFALGDAAFLHDIRFGASVLNLGKVYNQLHCVGANGKMADKGFDGFPYFSTIRTGAAAKLIDHENFKLGLSFDVTTPLFQNLIFDSGIQIEFLKFITLTSSWEYNVYETVQSAASWFPTVGVVFKFQIGTGFMKKDDWSKSDICPSAAWKNVNGTTNVISAGAVVRLGQPDENAPDIEILD